MPISQVGISILTVRILIQLVKYRIWWEGWEEVASVGFLLNTPRHRYDSRTDWRQAWKSRCVYANKPEIWPRPVFG